MTFGNAKDLLAQRLQDPFSTDFKTRCGEFLNEAMQTILSQSDAWPFLETEGTLAVVAATHTYGLTSIASDIASIMSIKGIDPDRQLRGYERRDFDRWFPDLDESTGRPSRYMVWGDEIVLHPTPSENETLTIAYYKTVSDLSSDSQSPPWPSRYDPVWITLGMALGLEYNDDNRASRYFSRAQVLLENMAGSIGIDADHVIVARGFSEGSPLRLEDMTVDPSRFPPEGS